MQSGILDWVLEQRKDTGWSAGETHILISWSQEHFDIVHCMSLKKKRTKRNEPKVSESGKIVCTPISQSLKGLVIKNISEETFSERK